MTDKKFMTKRNIRIISAAGFAFSVILCLYGWQSGLFTSQDKLQSFIDGLGMTGAFVFIAFQAVQVVVPILPGGISCLGGVILFGAWKGFLFNYIGICIGSAAAFMIAKNCGEPVLQAVFGNKFEEKYHKWMHLKYPKFRKMFWIGIFAPVAPDDFLCYLAGTTEMKFREFTACILMGKPLAIALYSLGLQEGMKLLQAVL